MIKIDIISGFLGAGKTTLIKKLFSDAFDKEKIVLIENEFGKIGIDGEFLKESGVKIKEINSGCICCSLVGDFKKSLKEVVDRFSPERIIIEPSGVGKLSDIVGAVLKAEIDVKINILCTVVDGGKCKMYMKNFGEFYIDQISEANTVLVSKTDKLSDEKIMNAVNIIRNINKRATIITTPINQLDGKTLLESLEKNVNVVDALIEELKQKHEAHHHHHDEDECCEHEHHHDEDECCEHEHHHDEDECCEHEHRHDEDECCEHEHHHDEDECCEHEHRHDEDECCEHEHHQDEDECCEHEHHHHGHDADEVFASVGIETPLSYSKQELSDMLKELCTDKYGVILRSKGIVKASDNEKWYYFDLVSGDYEIRTGNPSVMGRLCVIGSKINKTEIDNIFFKKVI